MAKSANASSKSSASKSGAGGVNSTATSTSISQATNKESSSARKSDVTSVSSTSSATSSSCASASSSPVAKQKTLSQTIMGRLFTTATYGKENSVVGSVGNPAKSYSRTVSTTPTHQRKSITEIKSDDRKILSSQNAANNKQKLSEWIA